MAGGALFRIAAVAAAVGSLLILVVLLANHVGFPMYLEIMEGTVLQHFQRAAAGQPVYTAPTPEFVALAYNPLYYYVSIPLSWLLGVNLVTLRVVAILGMAGIAAVLFLATRRRTGSNWWGLMAVGLFAAAYRAMDSYLDTAHSDSMLLFCALLGTYLLATRDGLAWRLAGIGALVAAFWFKQHGAIFLAGGFAWVVARDGPRRALPVALFAAALGPALYLLAGPAMFGSHFHYFTWEVPSGWTEPQGDSLFRIVWLLARPYGVLTLAGIWLFATTIRKPTLWHVQLLAATLSAVMGALDPGSSNNVFAALGMMVILWGTWGLAGLSARIAQPAVLLAFGALAYNPLDHMVPRDAAAKHREFIAYVRALPGPAYIPKFGQLPWGAELRPAVHWVALEDMIRGPGKDERNHPVSRKLLASLLNADGSRYVIMHNPLEADPVLSYLAADYKLAIDLGDRFRSLGNIPHRWGVVWPRYVYEYRPADRAAKVDTLSKPVF
jgi:hypothetical protein